MLHFINLMRGSSDLLVTLSNLELFHEYLGYLCFMVLSTFRKIF